MKKVVSWFRDRFSEPQDNDVYMDMEAEDRPSKLAVKIFSIAAFEDVKLIIEQIRESNVVALVDISGLKDKDIFELKRAINSLKRTCDAVEGDIAGLSEDWIVVTPGFAQIYKEKLTKI